MKPIVYVELDEAGNRPTTDANSIVVDAGTIGDLDNLRFIGMEAANGKRYMLLTKGNSTGAWVRAKGEYNNRGVNAVNNTANKFYSFDSAKELYQWLSDGEQVAATAAN